MTVIKVENIGKRYVIDHQKQQSRFRYETLSGALANCGKSAFNFLRHPLSSFNNTVEHEDFWALKDINFEINQGDRVGIIGRNGAGKSTLLKILSRITAPTTGKITIKGRVSSLLEVGTGFHPELTGRENIYLNGAILGMKRQEIKAKFDEIVAFAEVDKFLDTPVKHYSSGMYVRLAFAVAAHLEPEILIVDEVLAVGDAQFQKKCLWKMEQAGKEGRTVLFVSHNLPAVENLCKTGIVLKNGFLVFWGEVDKSISNYLKLHQDAKSIVKLRHRVDRKGEGRIRIIGMRINNNSEDTSTSVKLGDDLTFIIDYEAVNSIQNPRLIIGIYDQMNLGIARFDTEITGGLPSILARDGQVKCTVEKLSLYPGVYQANIAFMSNGIMEDYLIGAIDFEILAADFFNTGKLFTGSDANLVKVLFQHEWRAFS